MERVRRIPGLFLLTLCAVLCLTGKAWAAEGYSVDDVSMIRSVGIATYKLTTSGDCNLIAIVHDWDGRFVEFVSATVKVGETEKTVTFSGKIDDNYGVTAFLAGPDYAPLCSTTEVIPGNVFAYLYNDGTLAFQKGGDAENWSNLLELGQVNLKGYSWESQPFWCNYRDSVTRVVIGEGIQPLSTAYWFYDLYNLKEIRSLEKLDTSRLTSMRAMFAGCASLTSLDLSGFDTESVEDMFGLFGRCTGLTTLNLKGLDTHNVKDMSKMFVDCEALTSLNLSGLDTGSATSLYGMFAYCGSLVSLDLSRFDTGNVADMSGMFCDCSNLKTIFASEQFTMDNADSDDMFSGCTSLIGGNGTTYDTDHTDGEYARIDKPGAPGYFTDKNA
ncbi:MAG: BspA family leucine-rich repeat surface protein [Oscillibacter sp.]|nr:BspA family leucine-rich repeat surface protein [Oscillibacter sp.]